MATRTKLFFALLVLLLAAAAYWVWRSGTSKLATSVKGEPERKVLYWIDPMHPAYKSDKPGKAPDCGMDLVPVYDDEASQAQRPEGAIQITSQRQQLIGVTSAPVKYERVSHTIRAVGKVTFDETKVSRVHPRIEGWIEKVFVDFTGKEVKKGDPLLSIYSPELLATQQELLIAIKGKESLGDSKLEGISDNSISLYTAAKERLRLLDISDQQIAEVERTKQPIRALILHAPNSGFVLNRNAYERQKVGPETELYQIADLTTVWAIIDVFEYEAPMMKLGMPVDIHLSYMPGSLIRGKINYIYPQVDPTTRTLKVRVEIANPRFLLKPEMFVEAELKMDHGRQLMVPANAVLDSGLEQTVFVAHDDGYFEPRKVKVGAKFGDTVEILTGLKEGEKIVTSGNFLIDSESKLKSGTESMGGGHSGHAPATPPPAKPQPKKAAPQAQPDHSGHGPQGGRP